MLLTVFWDKRIEINDLGNLLRRPVGDAGRDQAAIAMADQHDIAKVLELQDAEYVLDMSIEIIRRACRMRALAKARVARRKEFMPGRRH